jgi:RND superfamily putative drug exporter
VPSRRASPSCRSGSARRRAARGGGLGGRGPLDAATQERIGEALTELTAVAEEADALAGAVSPPIPSEDGEAVQAVLPLRTDLGDALPEVVAELRAVDDVEGTTAYVTGPAAVFADFADGLRRIDGLLLLAAFGVVLLILLVVYRSPLLPFLVMRRRGWPYRRPGGLLPAAREGIITVNGQSQGIAIDPRRRRGHRLRPAPVPATGGAATQRPPLTPCASRCAARSSRSSPPAPPSSWRPVPALLRPGLQPRPRPDLGGQRRARRDRLADLPAGRPRPARPGRLLAVPPRYGSEPKQAAAGSAPPTRRPPPRPGARAQRRGLLAVAVFAPTFEADGLPLSEAVRGQPEGARGRRRWPATSTPAAAAPRSSSRRPTPGRTSRGRGPRCPASPRWRR